MLDYATLKVLWWFLIAALFIGFAVMDGHDMGVGALLPFVARDDTERRVAINTVGPHWDGNQVWLITAGGAIFAAWPMVYSAAFSGFYWAMLATLAALVLRPLGFEYRSKLPSPRWRATWDAALFASGVVPPLIFGVAFGNLLQGVPFTLDSTLRPSYTGTFFGLLNPLGLLAGVVSVAMIAAHGAAFLVLKTEGAIQARARRASIAASAVTIGAFLIAGAWVALGIDGFTVVSGALPGAAPDPLHKTVAVARGAWFANYRSAPVGWVLPALGVAGAALSAAFARRGRGGLAFVASSAAMTGVLGTVGFSMFPFVMPSSIDPRASLTLWDATSSQRTLGLMFWAAVILLPPALLYTAWAYRVMRGKVTAAFVKENETSTY